MDNSSTMNFKGIINRKVNKSTNHLQVVHIHTPTADNKNKKKNFANKYQYKITLSSN